MAFVRAFAAALFSAPLLLAVPATAAARPDTRDRLEARSEPFDPSLGQSGASEPISSGRLEAMMSGKATSHPVWISADPDVFFNSMTPADDHGGVLASPQGREHSTVPLPTGLSLFGAGILALGLIGFLSGSSRRVALETGRLADTDEGSAAAEAAPPTRFRIEIQSDRECQLRHTASARGTIDLIADLLNDGWDLVCIRDRNGLALDYDDVIEAWNNERRADR